MAAVLTQDEYRLLVRAARAACRRVARAGGGKYFNDDYFTVALEGAWEAFSRYKPDGGRSPYSWCVLRAKGAVLDALREEYRQRNGHTRDTRTGDDPLSLSLDYVKDGEEDNILLRTRGEPDVYCEVQLKDLLRPGQRLNEREMYVLKRLYEGESLTDVGKELGVTVSRISQIRSELRRKVEWTP